MDLIIISDFQLCIFLRRWPTWCTLALFYNTFIIILYMFRAVYAHHQEVELYWYSTWYRPLKTVCCFLSLTVWVAMQLARGWCIPGALCIIVRWVVVSWNTGTLALGLFCTGWLHSSFFGTLGCYHLLLYWRKLVLIVWSYKVYYTKWLHYFYTFLYWCSCIDILVLFVLHCICHLVQVSEYVMGPLRKLATKIVGVSVFILGVNLNFYLSSRKIRTVFFYIRRKSRFCAV